MQMNMKTANNRQAVHPRRGGAVIVVVLALMTTLVFLGLFFYNFSKDEVNISRNIQEATAQAAPYDDGFTINDRATIDFGLQQIIVSTPQDRLNSALMMRTSTGQLLSPYSLLASRIGTVNANGSPRSVHPFTGRGIAVVADVNGDGVINSADVNAAGIDVDRDPMTGPGGSEYPQILFDYDGDGNPDTDHTGFILNLSGAVHMPGALPSQLDGINLDVGYTYPDINNPFLAMDYWDLGVLSNPADDVHVVKPSFFNPGLHPERRIFRDFWPPMGDGVPESGFFRFYTDISPIGTDGDPATTAQSFRPHRGHFNAANPAVARFIRPGAGLAPSVYSGGTIQALSGDITRRLRPFPKLDFNTATGLPIEPITGLGVWDGTSATVYDFDIDIDKDGTKDSILIDLDHPLITFPDGRQFVPIYATKIIDQDGLINVNAHGNMADFQQKSNLGVASIHDHIYSLFFSTGNPWAHFSNLGFSPAEVNPMIALFAEVAVAAMPPHPFAPFFSNTNAANQSWNVYRKVLAQRHDGTSVLPVPIDRTSPADDPALPHFMDRQRLANLEFASLLLGRPEYDSSSMNILTNPDGSPVFWPGRFGIDLRLTPDRAVNILFTWQWATFLSGTGFFPAPGIAFLDELPRAPGTLGPQGIDGLPDDYLPLGSPDGNPDAIDDNGNDSNPNNDAYQRWFPIPGATMNPYFAETPASHAPGLDPAGGVGGYTDPRLGVIVPNAIHPTDASGLSDSEGFPSYARPGGPRPGTRSLRGNPASPTNPTRWPLYPGGTTPVNGPLAYPAPHQFGIQTQGTGTYANAFGGGLQLNSFDQLTNDPGEVNLFSGTGVQADDPFDVKELAALQLSKVDYSDSAMQSRLRNLLPVNFEQNLLASYIRSQFTTHSWDRLEFAFGPAGLPAGARAWEFNDADPALTPAQYAPNGYTFPFRFPPRFGGATPGTEYASRHEFADPGNPGSYFERTLNGATGRVDGSIVALDPFRPEFRRLLTIEGQNLQTPQLAWRTLFPQRRMHLNRILSDDILARGAAASSSLNPPVLTDWRFTDRAFDDKGNPISRHVMPHGTVQTGGTIDQMVHLNMTQGLASGLGAAHAYNSLNAIRTGNDPQGVIQEWWARYDRQRLARDIYVLLYTLAGGAVNDTVAGQIPVAGFNPDQFNPTGAAIDPDLARELAQFAVNYVDAMDRDNVITRFDYDPNLSDGWGTSGSPLTAPGAVVYGVEAQSLCFSEVLFVETEAAGTDNPMTLWDESVPNNRRHRFLFVELRNVSPFPVELDEDWRLVRLRSPDSATEEVHVSVEFKADTMGARKSIAPGANFLIGCHDGTVTKGGGGAIGSEMYADYTGNAELECIVPKSVPTTVATNSTAPTQRFLDLDLTPVTTIGNDHEYFTFIAASAPYTGTTLVEQIPQSTGATNAHELNFSLSLQRRRHTTGGVTDDWVEVDRIKVLDQTRYSSAASAPILDASSFNDQATLVTELASHFVSQERPNPWAGDVIDGTNNSVLTRGLFDHPKSNHLAAPELHHSLDNDAGRKHRRNDKLAELIATNSPGLNWLLDSTTGQPYLPFWQPHFDRDLVSKMDLLSIPLNGNRGFQNGHSGAVTNQAPWYDGRRTGGITRSLCDTPTGRPGPFYQNGHRTAAVRFLYPTPDDASNPLNPLTIRSGHTWDSVKSESYDNRWYRLLNFVEVPPRTEDYAYAQLDWRRRTAGRVNINQIRHEHVFAGVVDDDVHHNPLANVGGTSNAFQGGPAVTTDVNDAGRLWFDELRASRDGVNGFIPNNLVQSGPVPPVTPYIDFPGTPLSKPYKPLGTLDPANPGASVESTILRHHSPNSPGTGGSAFENTTILEARPFDDFNNNGGSGTNDDDQIDYHTRNRILAKVANLTTERSNVFAIWIGYQLHEAHEPLPGVVQIGAKADDFPLHRELVVVDMSRLEEAYNPITGRYDFEKFIIYRQVLAE